MSRGVPLTAINGGMTRLRVKGAARKDSLYQLTNAYVTAGNTIKPRAGTIRNVDLAPTTGAATTKGLVAHQGQLHVFSAAKVAVPPGYVDHVLSHPAYQSTYVPPFPGGNNSYNPIVESLLHFEDGNGSTSITDNGTNPSIWTAVAASESTTQAKFGTGSLSFLSGSNTRHDISAPLTTSSALDIFTGDPDFTVEFWFYPTRTDLASASILSYGTNNVIGGKGFAIYAQGTQLTTQHGGGSNWIGSDPVIVAALVANTWHHIAFCRDGTAVRLYVNGTLTGIGNVIASPGSPVGGAVVSVGSNIQFGGTDFQCYVDDFRVTKGSCLYGGPFSPPAAALTTVPNIPYNIASLIHFDDGANSTAFVDAAVAVWTPFGAAKEVLAPQKLGSGSGAFLADADYIRTDVTAGGTLDFALKEQDFTVEAFVYPTDVTSGAIHFWFDIAHRAAGTNNNTLFNLTSTAHDLTLHDYNGGSATFTAVNAFPTAGIWYHVAVVRYGYDYILFVNGVQVGRATMGLSTMPSVSTGAHWYIGSDGFNGLRSATGYIDEFRAIQGLAAYLTTFTPPTAPYTVPGFLPIQLKEIHFAAPFMGFLYVVAEFVTDGGSGLGTVFHYWLQTSGTWLANTAYQVGQIVSPTVPNGMNFRAERVSTPSPKWAPSTLKAVNDKVEPTTPNGFLYTATVVDGTNPITGTTEPIWPTKAGELVFEESEKLNTGEVAAPAPQPSLTTPSPGTGGKYTNPYNVFLGK